MLYCINYLVIESLCEAICSKVTINLCKVNARIFMLVFNLLQ